MKAKPHLQLTFHYLQTYSHLSMQDRIVLLYYWVTETRFVPKKLSKVAEKLGISYFDLKNSLKRIRKLGLVPVFLGHNKQSTCTPQQSTCTPPIYENDVEEIAQ